MTWYPQNIEEAKEWTELTPEQREEFGYQQDNPKQSFNLVPMVSAIVDTGGNTGRMQGDLQAEAMVPLTHHPVATHLAVQATRRVMDETIEQWRREDATRGPVSGGVK